MQKLQGGELQRQWLHQKAKATEWAMPKSSHQRRRVRVRPVLVPFVHNMQKRNADDNEEEKAAKCILEGTRSTKKLALSGLRDPRKKAEINRQGQCFPRRRRGWSGGRAGSEGAVPSLSGKQEAKGKPTGWWMHLRLSAQSSARGAW